MKMDIHKPIIVATVPKTIWEKCQENYYTSKLDYASSAKITSRLNDGGEALLAIIEKFPEKPIRPIIEQLMSLISPLLRELDSIKADKAAYHADERRLDAEFRADLKAEFKTEDYPDESAIFSLAWEEGHSSGYGEVLNHYSTIVDKFSTNIRRTKDLMKIAKAFLKGAHEINYNLSRCAYCGGEKGHTRDCLVRLAEESIKLN